jgi:integrase
MRALPVKRLDLERGRIDVAEAMPERAIELDTPKNHKRRTVPVPGSFVDELAKHVEGKGPDELVFTNSAGGCSTTRTFAATSSTRRRGRSAACNGFTPHDIRHTTGFTGGRRGSERQGFAAAARTCVSVDDVGRYSALFDADLAAVAERLGKAAEDSLRTSRLER